MTSVTIRRLAGVAGILVGLAGITSVVLQRRAAREREDVLRSLATYQQQAARPIAAGDRVRIVSRSGTFKPDETGAAVEVVGDRQTGVVVGEERPHLVRVRWDAQRWQPDGTNTWIDLPSFEATIHDSYLAAVR